MNFCENNFSSSFIFDMVNKISFVNMDLSIVRFKTTRPDLSFQTMSLTFYPILYLHLSEIYLEHPVSILLDMVKKLKKRGTETLFSLGRPIGHPTIFDNSFNILSIFFSYFFHYDLALQR